MNKYLVVGFDRYDTHKSSHTIIEADSPLQAALIFYGLDKDPGLDLIQVDDTFTCEPGEESDLLIYLIG